MRRPVFDGNGEPCGTFDDGVTWAIEQMATCLGISVNDFSWDAATEEYEGDVRAVISNAMRAALGDDETDRLIERARRPAPSTEGGE